MSARSAPYRRPASVPLVVDVVAEDPALLRLPFRVPALPLRVLLPLLVLDRIHQLLLALAEVLQPLAFPRRGLVSQLLHQCSVTPPFLEADDDTAHEEDAG